MKRVLLTGATGFVGARLAHRLISDGHDVHLLVRPDSTSFRLPALRHQADVHAVDLSDGQAVSAVVASAAPEWVFHLAVHGAYSWQKDALQMVQTNIVGTANLVEACLRVGFEGFVNTGSSSEYGFKDHAPGEDEDCVPNSYYSLTKNAATSYCRFAARTHDVHIPTLRLYSVYGPWEEPNRLVPTLTMHALEGQLPPLVSPDTARDFVFIDDVVDAYLAAIAARTTERGAIYNVGSGEQTTIQDVVDTARNVFGVKQDPQWGSMPNHGWDTNVWVSDNRKILKELNWRPKVSLAEGLTRTADWLRAEPSIFSYYRDAIMNKPVAHVVPVAKAGA